jgi:hypothetical protein
MGLPPFEFRQGEGNEKAEHGDQTCETMRLGESCLESLSESIANIAAAAVISDMFRDVVKHHASPGWRLDLQVPSPKSSAVNECMCLQPWQSYIWHVDAFKHPPHELRGNVRFFAAA